nr:hypothetical protein [uncultured Celeribacter sp.]
MLTRFIAALIALMGLILPGLASELVMVEQQGCAYCARWNAEIAPIYPKTPEGQFAPLRRIDLHSPLPRDLSLAGPLIFTPTFLFVEDGKELARIEGYAGDEMFWAMLSVILRDHSSFVLEAPDSTAAPQGGTTHSGG